MDTRLQTEQKGRSEWPVKRDMPVGSFFCLTWSVLFFYFVFHSRFMSMSHPDGELATTLSFLLLPTLVLRFRTQPEKSERGGGEKAKKSLILERCILLLHFCSAVFIYRRFLSPLSPFRYRSFSTSCIHFYTHPLPLNFSPFSFFSSFR